MKVLIIQQKMIGDVLTSSILFEAIKSKYPSSELHYLIYSHTRPVVENNPFIDKFQLFTTEIESNAVKFLRFLKSIRKEKYDVVIDVYGKLNTALISLYSGASVRTAYYKKYTAFAFNNTFKRVESPKHSSSLAIENRMKLLESVDIPFENYRPKIYLTASETQQAQTFLEGHTISLSNPIYMISVLGSSDSKTYPATYMAQLLDQLILFKPKAQLLFNYIPKQTKEAQEIYNHCLTETQKHIHFNVFGKSLREFLALTYHCNALIGNEGGANNMAKALDVPTFTIFSPYLNKKNWFGENETHKHVAVHISDFVPYSDNDVLAAKENPKEYYLKFKPEYIVPALKSFVSNLD